MQSSVFYVALSFKLNKLTNSQKLYKCVSHQPCIMQDEVKKWSSRRGKHPLFSPNVNHTIAQGTHIPVGWLYFRELTQFVNTIWQPGFDRRRCAWPLLIASGHSRARAHKGQGHHGTEESRRTYMPGRGDLSLYPNGVTTSECGLVMLMWRINDQLMINFRQACLTVAHLH